MNIYQKKESLTEIFGHFGGYLLGPFIGLLSFIRQARVFHPRGICFRARVESLSNELNFHPYALVRVSAGLWKKSEWPDALGVALRFTRFVEITEIPSIDDQDLLFATFEHPWNLPFSPLTTNQHDFLDNDYYSVLPFRTPSSMDVLMKLTPVIGGTFEGSRESRIRQAVENGSARYVLLQRKKRGPWTRVASIALEEEIDIDQEALAFDPFLNGLAIAPSGFFQHLRIGTYKFSQRFRPRQKRPQCQTHRPLLFKPWKSRNKKQTKEGLMQVSEVMSKGVISVTSLDSVRKVAKLMKDQDIGAIPVIDKGEPVGFVTDRDIVVNCVASGYNLDGPVSHAMTENVVSVNQDQDVKEASRLMKQHQVSRILVTDKDRHPIGMVGLKDLATEGEDLSGQTISKIKQ